MKFFFWILILSIIIMFYWLFSDNLNLIVTFWVIVIASSIISTSIWKEDLIKEIYNKINKN